MLNISVNLKRFFFALFALFFLAVPLSVIAQFTPGMGITVALDPTYPAPGDIVTVTLTSYSSNLNQAEIAWSVDGVYKKDGVGLTSFSVNAPAVGVNRVVDAVITYPSGDTASKRISISPAEVSLFAQGDSYTPPFYKGRSLISPEGDVTLIATPNFIDSNGSRLSSSELVFTWKQNSKVLGDRSGVGKNTFIAKADRIPGQTTKVEVKVASVDKSLNAGAVYTIVPQTPKIIFYENSPLLGIIFNKALVNTYTLTKDEFSIVAYPYFFETNNPEAGDINYKWTVNNSSAAPTGQQNQITLRSPQGQSGTSIVSLAVRNAQKLFEEAATQLRISFGAPQQQNSGFGI